MVTGNKKEERKEENVHVIRKSQTPSESVATVLTEFFLSGIQTRPAQTEIRCSTTCATAVAIVS